MSNNQVISNKAPHQGVRIRRFGKLMSMSVRGSWLGFINPPLNKAANVEFLIRNVIRAG